MLHPRSRHHVVPISVPPRIHPAQTHRSSHQHGHYPTSAFPTGYHTGQPIFLNPYLTPGFLPLPILPRAIPISGRMASSFGFVRPTASAFPYPGYAPVQHVHHHHYHHRPPPSSDPAFVSQEGVNPSFNASGRAFPSRQAWERHSGQATGNRPQVFDPDGYPIPHDEGDEGPVVVDADEGESAAGMEMVLHQRSQKEMQYHGRREEDTDMDEAQTYGAAHVPQSLSSSRHYRDGTAQGVTNGMDTDTPSAYSVRIHEQDVTPSIVMRPETANTENVNEHDGGDLSGDEVADERQRHGQMTKSLYERTNPDREICVGDQRRTQSLHT
ncbi:hypothetical protein QFC22_002864 [Naganishia vaughanmartiniae]|uniref:Uncharacterized protein n=1 Tax=Naganishia vaughanmartiniae TaxID=1424756 RepID=A0ACC2XC53_9TREE|nr:hypothetical protein QFC22_002864 [Naganishia vaughanmartiniae]